MESWNNHNPIQESSQEVVFESRKSLRERKIAFRSWTILAGTSINKLAKCIGISQPALSKALEKETIRVDTHDKLCKEGVPGHLLPRPENVRPGPKPKAANAEPVINNFESNSDCRILPE